MGGGQPFEGLKPHRLITNNGSAIWPKERMEVLASPERRVVGLDNPFEGLKPH